MAAAGTIGQNTPIAVKGNRSVSSCLLLPIEQFLNSRLNPPKSVVKLILRVKSRRLKQAKDLLRRFYNSETFEYQEIRSSIMCVLNMER